MRKRRRCFVFLFSQFVKPAGKAVRAALSGWSMHFFPDVRSFAEFSKRIVTGGKGFVRRFSYLSDVADIRYFGDLVCKKHPEDAFI